MGPPGPVAPRWQRGPGERQLGRDDVRAGVLGVGSEVRKQQPGPDELETE